MASGAFAGVLFRTVINVETDNIKNMIKLTLRRLLFDIKVIIFIIIVVFAICTVANSAKAFASDKASIELACGDSRAAITCQKFKDDVCVESQLAFDTKDGKHIVSTYQPPQNFVVPTIADGLQCDARLPKGTYFVIWYTPGCSYAACFTIRLFDLTGRKLSSKEEKDVYKFPSHALPKETVTLRGYNQ